MSEIYNFNLCNLPEREIKPRTIGITMVMDKGISLRQAQDFVDTSSDFVDFVKLGFGTSLISKNVKEKIKLYQKANLKENEDNSYYIDQIKRDLEELDDKEANEYLEDLSKA